MSGHLTLLVAEAVLCGGIVLLLFRLRHVIGMAPLYMVLGALQYLQFVFAASLRIEMLPGVTAGPATTVLFPLTIFVVLLTYVEDDAAATRQFAYGVVVCNVTLYSVAALAGQHVDMPGVSNPLDLPRALFQQPWRIMIASSVAILLDMVATVVVFEWVSRRLPGLFLRLWLTASAVMVLDGVVFSTLGFAGQSGYVRLMTGSVLGKLMGATVYAVAVTGYVRLFERQRGQRGQVDAPGDVFRWLTYRQRYEEARSLMARDALTGLYNRGYFDEFAPRQLAHADRARHPMSLVVIDVDGLKTTNDRHGHRAGDDLVRFVAAELRHMVRASDAACRYGGDEFVVVLTTADPAAARIFAERLRQNVRANSSALSPAPPWAPATVTVGVATTPADGTTIDALLHCADERLYEGKRQGRDRVIGAPPVS
jgi:diguanylate cyclase (GGDEF)-like protein